MFLSCSTSSFQDDRTYMNDIDIINKHNAIVKYIDSVNCLSYPHELEYRRDIVSIYCQNQIDNNSTDCQSYFSSVNSDSLLLRFNLLNKQKSFFRINAYYDTVRYLQNICTIFVKNYYYDDESVKISSPLFQKILILDGENKPSSGAIVDILYYHGNNSLAQDLYDFKKSFKIFCRSRASN